MYLAIDIADALRLVLYAGDGEVCRQDGIGVDKQVEMVVNRFLRLLLRTVRFAEEAGALGNGLLVDTGTC